MLLCGQYRTRLDAPPGCAFYLAMRSGNACHTLCTDGSAVNVEDGQHGSELLAVSGR